MKIYALVYYTLHKYQFMKLYAFVYNAVHRYRFMKVYSLVYNALHRLVGCLYWGLTPLEQLRSYHGGR